MNGERDFWSRCGNKLYTLHLTSMRVQVTFLEQRVGGTNRI
jgi:hypothetical protein